MGAPLAMGRGDPSGTTRVFVGCVEGSPAARAPRGARPDERRKTLERIITLVGVPKPDQARLVAIVAVELVAASEGGRGAEASRPSSPPSPRRRLPRSRPDRSSLRSRARARWRVLVAGGVRQFAGLPRALPADPSACSASCPEA